MQTFKSKALVEKYYRQKISSDSTWAIHALACIYSYQEATEKDNGNTIVYNGVGFTFFDAPFLTSLYQSYSKSKSLSDKQLDCLKKLMPKYSRQLVAHSIRCNKLQKVNGYYQFCN